MTETHYDILGLPETATHEEIKKTYRKLSLQYHPDRPGGDQTKYQKINEAYEILGDEQKKQEYDMMRNSPFSKMGGQHPNVDEVFSNIFGMNPFAHMMNMNMHHHPGGGHPGVQTFFFRHGGGAPSGMEKPTPIIKNITLTMEQVLNGGNIPIDIERWLVENGNKVFEHETIYIPIPKGIDDGEIIIVREKGNINENDIKGDLKIFIKVENNTQFKRYGLDLILEKNISLKEALCGFSFEMIYLNGKSYTINNSPGVIITPGHKKIIPNMGLKREEHTGNLVIAFNIIFPSQLDEEKIKKLGELL